MMIVKVAEGKFINVDRMTYVEPYKKGQAIVHFAVGGGEFTESSCNMKLEQQEAEHFVQWLESHQST